MKTRVFILAGGILLSTFHSDVLAAPVPAQWRNPLPQGDNLNVVAFANGLYVAMGDYGTAVTSYDGTHWQAHPTPTAASLYAVCGGGGLFVAGGAQGTILLSPDGTNWLAQGAFTTNEFLSAAYGQGVFVLGDAGGNLFSSTNGTAWSMTFSNFNSPVKGLAFGNGLFVAINPYGSVASSIDGENWMESSTPAPDPYEDGLGQNAICFGNGLFYVDGIYTDATAAGELMANYDYVMSSSDGLHWTYDYELAVGSFEPMLFGPSAAGSDQLVVYDTINYDAIATSGAYTGSASGSGLAQTKTFPTSISSASFGASGFVIVGPGDEIAFSPDATNWTQVGNESSGVVTGLAVASNLTVASVLNASNAILVSSNNAAFLSASAANDINLWDVTFQNGRFIAVGDSGTVNVSSNGTTWTGRSSSATADLHRVRYLAGGFMAVGKNGTVITSPTGDAWSLRTSGTAVGLNGMSASPTLFVAVGNGGNLITSPDKINWSAQYSTVTNELSDVAFGDGTFVAVGSDGAIISSTDGINWTAQASGVAVQLQTIIFNEGLFLVVGYNGLILTSPDAVTWAPHYLATPFNLYSIAPNGNGYLLGGNANYLANGDNGFILQIGSLLTPGLSASGFRATGFGFTFSGAAGQAYVLQSSSDLSNWTPLFSFTNSYGVTNLADATASQTGHRFYRVVPQ